MSLQQPQQIFSTFYDSKFNGPVGWLLLAIQSNSYCLSHHFNLDCNVTGSNIERLWKGKKIDIGNFVPLAIANWFASIFFFYIFFSIK